MPAPQYRPPKGEPQCAAALAAGCTIRDAAKAGGVNEGTVRRRLREPDYKAQVAGLRNDLLGLAAKQLADYMGEAIDCLRELLACSNPFAKQKAAAALITLALRAKESVEFEARIVVLENSVERNQREANRLG